MDIVPGTTTPTDRALTEGLPDAPVDIQAVYDAQMAELGRLQDDHVALVEQARATGEAKALVVSATGTGKTTTAARVTAHHLESSDRPGRVMFISHQVEISDQALQRFRNYVPSRSTLELYRGGDDSGADVVFTTFQSLNASDPFDARDFSLTIVDEAHHEFAPTYAPRIDRFAENSFVLALTATPRRGDGIDLVERYGEPIVEYPLERAIEDGNVAPVDYRVITTRLLRTPSLADLRKTGDDFFVDITLDEKVQLIDRGRAEVANPRTVVFCNSIKEASLLATVFGDDAVAIHGDLKKTERNQGFADFRSGDASIAVVVDLFNEGVDIPEANHLVFFRNTESLPVWLHQLGRGLRWSPGKTGVRVDDVVCSFERIRNIQRLAADVQSGLTVSSSMIDGSGQISVLPHEFDVYDAIAAAENRDRLVELMTVQDDATNFGLFRELYATIARVPSREEVDRISERVAARVTAVLGDGPLSAEAIRSVYPNGLFPPSDVILSRYGSMARAFNEARGLEHTRLKINSSEIEGLLEKRLAAHDDPVLTAELNSALLAAMMPRARNMARRDSKHQKVDADDVLSGAIAALWKEIRALPRDVEVEHFTRTTTKAVARGVMAEVRAFNVSSKGEVELTADRLAQARRYDAANDSERTDPTAMAAIAAWRIAALSKGLSKINERLELVVRGINSGNSKDDLGEYMGVGRERVRQLENSGLSDLRSVLKRERDDIWDMHTDGAFGEYDSGAPRSREPWWS